MLEIALSCGFLSVKREKFDLSKACAKWGTGTVESESGQLRPHALQKWAIGSEHDPCDRRWPTPHYPPVGEVYALYSARNGAVRYVGQTSYDRHFRFKQHKRDTSERLHQWIVGEWRAGYPVRCGLLQRCSNAELDSFERDWIGKFPNLLNERKKSYPRHWPACMRPRPPVIPEIAEYIRGHLFNVDGHQGVHYQIGWDIYFVMVYTRSSEGPRWLGHLWHFDAGSGRRPPHQNEPRRQRGAAAGLRR
jgi:hypothetical protein